ncbi:hypothetical protein SEA_RUDY_2 [Microbacterium phage Rudy]|nr:hypothetical protein SEA_RUDY_2 [Microbacterium phage Rudy]QQO39511.1 hypothetical protein SEA_PHABIA_2 [Microbacterium phage Phabia]QWY80491.1 hypothetical protein SEA_QUAMMI_2 [Microbacterium phage Quammi]UVG33848.1 hypothetical protein SEA_VICEROY_3 [Microbacterium phage Viceroy]UVG33954.1 hypothetical protein SEA_WHEELIE_3 [Microbacterium phage Wheelie]
MTTTTIDVQVTLGGVTYKVAAVGDPADVMFALQVGRTVSEILLEHREPEPPIVIPAPDGVYVTDLMRDDGEGFGERIEEDPL